MSAYFELLPIRYEHRSMCTVSDELYHWLGLTFKGKAVWWFPGAGFDIQGEGSMMIPRVYFVCSGFGVGAEITLYAEL